MSVKTDPEWTIISCPLLFPIMNATFSGEEISITNYVWLIINNNFWVLKNHRPVNCITSWGKNVIHGKPYIFLLLTCFFMPSTHETYANKHWVHILLFFSKRMAYSNPALWHLTNMRYLIVTSLANVHACTNYCKNDIQKFVKKFVKIDIGM